VRIERLAITNFRGFERREFRLNSRFTLFAGDNASGKSSVLDALAVAAGSWFLGARGIDRSPGIDPDDVRVFAQPHRDRVTFEKQFPVRIECSGVVLGKSLQWARELRLDGGRTTTVDAKPLSEAAADAVRRMRSGEDVTLPLVCAYGTERLWFEKLHRRPKGELAAPRGKPSRLDGYRDSFDFAIQETALVHWFRDESTAQLPSKGDTAALGIVKGAIACCVEGVNSVYYDGRYRDLVIETEAYGPQLLRNLSDGQRIMVTLVAELARRIAVLNPHLEKDALVRTPGLVTIDELDLHLHPKWQRRIIHDLKRVFPEVQFVCTTHSPQLIGEAEPDEVRLLDEGETTQPPRSYGMDASRVLEEVMGAPSRNQQVSEILTRLFRSIDEEKYEEAKRVLADLERLVGPDDPEVTRARSLMAFMESPI
jgi:predicted ATP-binding protein involved in virulence